MISRREFGLGLTASVAVAPATLASVPTIVERLFDVRWFAVYDIGTDQVLVRRDVANFVLSRPKLDECVWEVPDWLKTKIEKEAAEAIEVSEYHVTHTKAPAHCVLTYAMTHDEACRVVQGV